MTGNQTAVPKDATVKLEAIMVPDQKPDRILELIRGHLASYRIGGDDLEVMFSMEPSRTPLNHPMVDRLTGALWRARNQLPVVMNRFAAYAPYYLFGRLKIPGFDMACAQPDQCNHAPNECLDLRCFQNGVLTCIAVPDEFGCGGSGPGQSGHERWCLPNIRRWRGKFSHSGERNRPGNRN